MVVPSKPVKNERSAGISQLNWFDRLRGIYGPSTSSQEGPTPSFNSETGTYKTIKDDFSVGANNKLGIEKESESILITPCTDRHHYDIPSYEAASALPLNSPNLNSNSKESINYSTAKNTNKSNKLDGGTGDASIRPLESFLENTKGLNCLSVSAKDKVEKFHRPIAKDLNLARSSLGRPLQINDIPSHESCSNSNLSGFVHPKGELRCENSINLPTNSIKNQFQISPVNRENHSPLVNTSLFGDSDLSVGKGDSDVCFSKEIKTSLSEDNTTDYLKSQSNQAVSEGIASISEHFQFIANNLSLTNDFDHQIDHSDESTPQCKIDKSNVFDALDQFKDINDYFDDSNSLVNDNLRGSTACMQKIGNDQWKSSDDNPREDLKKIMIEDMLLNHKCMNCLESAGTFAPPKDANFDDLLSNQITLAFADFRESLDSQMGECKHDLKALPVQYDNSDDFLKPNNRLLNEDGHENAPVFIESPMTNSTFNVNNVAFNVDRLNISSDKVDLSHNQAVKDYSKSISLYQNDENQNEKKNLINLPYTEVVKDYPNSTSLHPDKKKYLDEKGCKSILKTEIEPEACLDVVLKSHDIEKSPTKVNSAEYSSLDHESGIQLGSDRYQVFEEKTTSLLQDVEKPYKIVKITRFEIFVCLIEAIMEGDENEVRGFIQTFKNSGRPLHHLIDACNLEGVTGLHCAVEINQTSICKLLVQGAGANVNVADEYGWTPLHGAAHKGCLEIISILLSAGADVEARDISGKTPTDVCTQSEIKRLLSDVLYTKCTGHIIKAIYDFERTLVPDARGDELLQVKKGQVLYVLCRLDPVWWLVSLRDLAPDYEIDGLIKGYIPRRFVQ